MSEVSPWELSEGYNCELLSVPDTDNKRRQSWTMHLNHVDELAKPASLGSRPGSARRSSKIHTSNESQKRGAEDQVALQDI